VQVINAVPTLSLTTDSGTLASAGTAGNEVTVTALVRDANNTVMPGVTVNLSADSGSLTLTNRVTNAQGIVTEKLGTGGDATSRAIKHYGQRAGRCAGQHHRQRHRQQADHQCPPTINVGASADITVKLVDSAGNALVGKTVQFAPMPTA
jgi:hypothetical protein